MNTELIKVLDRQLLEVIGQLVLGDVDGAKRQLGTMHQGLNIVITACDEHPMTREELIQDFELQLKEILR